MIIFFIFLLLGSIGLIVDGDVVLGIILAIISLICIFACSSGKNSGVKKNAPVPPEPKKQNMKKYCSNCGEEAENGCIYCAKCGHKI